MPIKKFEPGVSGNPKGRPKDKTPGALLRKTIAEDMPAIVKTLVEQAKNGDTAAAKLLLDRYCPSLKQQALPITLPPQNSLTEQGNEVIRAIMSGAIPPDVGSQLLTALSHQLKIIDVENITARLDTLERFNNEYQQNTTR